MGDLAKRKIAPAKGGKRRVEPHKADLRAYRVELLVVALRDEATIERIAKDVKRIFARGVIPLTDSEECVGSFKITAVKQTSCVWSGGKRGSCP